MKTIKYLLILLSIAIPLSGCGPKGPQFKSESPYQPLASLKEGAILHVPTGVHVSKEQLFPYISSSRVVYVGETHDNLDHHKVQLDIIKALEERNPGKVAVGMEMFRNPSQPALDKWVNGELDDKDFVKVYMKNWGFDFDYYKDIFEYVHKKKIPLIALNASKKQMMGLRHRGAKDAPKVTLPEMDKNDPYHQAMVQAIYGDASHGKGNFEGFYQMQLLWEETMAQAISDYLKSSDGEGRQMVVLAGGGHIEYGFGIPKRVFRRLPESYTTILLTAPEVIGDEKIVQQKGVQLLDVKLPDVPLYIADFVWATGYEILKVEKPKLGVQLTDKEGVVSVVHVFPGSAAEKSGIKEGDVIEKFNGEPVKEFFDLVYLIRMKQFGQDASVSILRGEERHEIKVHFEKPE